MAITCPTQSVSHIQMITSDLDASASLITSCGLAAAEELATQNYFNLICLFTHWVFFRSLFASSCTGESVVNAPHIIILGPQLFPGSQFLLWPPNNDVPSHTSFDEDHSFNIS